MSLIGASPVFMSKKQFSIFAAVLIMGISLSLFASTASANIAVSWFATSTTGNIISPTLVNGTYQIASSSNVIDSGLTSGNCVQASTGGLLTSSGSPCGSGSGSAYPFPLVSNATSTLTNFLGGIGATTIQATSTATSTIANANTVLWVPADFATNGCAGNASYTDFGQCVNGLYSLASTSGNYAVQIMVPAIKVTQAQWTTAINFNGPAIVSFDCVQGAQMAYGGTATSTIFNMSNPTGHLVSQDYGCLYMGSATLIAAGQTNSNTTVGIGFGGSHGAVGVDFHDNSVNGYGQDMEIGKNAYMAKIENNSVSGGNGGLKGDLIYVDKANNSGEALTLSGNNWTDPGNTVAGNDIYISDGSDASTFITGGSLDDAQIYAGASDGMIDIGPLHVENSDCSAYGSYIPILGTSAQSTQLNVHGIEVANDCTGANSFTTIVKHGQNLLLAGLHIDNYAGGTITLAIDHSLNNGSESENISQVQISGGSMTNIVSNQAYSQAAGASTITDVANSFPIAWIQNSNNTADFRNGNQNVATVDSNGNWNLGGANGGLTVVGAITEQGTGNSPFSGSLTIAKTLGVTQLTSLTNATSTLFSTGYASSTLYYGANLASCNGGTNALTWSAGQFGCNTISGGSSFGYPFNYFNNTGTTSPLLLLASTTIGNGTLGLTVSGPATTTGTADFTGNVGIGTTSPAFTESVQGNQYTSGSAFFGGAITATSTLAITTTAGSVIPLTVQSNTPGTPITALFEDGGFADNNAIVNITDINSTDSGTTTQIVNSGTGPSFAVGTSTAAGSNKSNFQINANGHIVVAGPTPSVSGGTSSIVANSTDNSGQINVAGTALTSVTLTFAKAWITAPNCTESDNVLAVGTDITSISTTQIVFGFGTGGVTTANLWYQCSSNQ